MPANEPKIDQPIAELFLRAGEMPAGASLVAPTGGDVYPTVGTLAIQTDVDVYPTLGTNPLFQQLSDFLNEFSRAEYWNSLLDALRTVLIGNAFSAGLIFVMFLFGFMTWQRLMWAADRIVKRANREEYLSSEGTLQLMVASSLASLLCWLPLLMTGIALYVTSSRFATPDFHASLGLGLIAVFVVGAGFRLMQEFFSRGGLSEAIYGFKFSNARYLLNRIEITVFLMAPFVFLLVFVSHFQEAHWYASVGRLSFFLAGAIAFTQFNNLFWPSSRLYQRLQNDESMADSRLVRHRVPFYILGVTAFFLAGGLTLGGWLEHASAFSFNVALTVIAALSLFAIRTVLTKRSTELIRRYHLIEDFGRSSDDPATARSQRVQQLVSRYSGTAHRGLEFLSITVFTAISYLIWRNWIQLPPELFQIQIGGLALSGIVVAAKLLAIGLITYYFARELPSLAVWCLSHQTKIEIQNQVLATRMMSAVLAWLGVWVASRTLDVELPVIPWLGTLLTISALFAARHWIEDGLAGIRLLFDSRVVPGDCIDFEGRFGRVTEVNTFSTVVEDNLGTRCIIPNARVLSHTIIKTRDDEVFPLVIDVSIPKNADAYQAQAIMTTVAQRDPAVISEPPPHVRFTGFRMNDIRFQIRMLVSSAADIQTTRERIEEQLAVEFERHEITGTRRAA